MKILLGMLLVLCSPALYAQYSFVAKITNQEQQPFEGATVTIPQLKKRAIADRSGIVVIQGLPEGKYEVEFSSAGFLTEGRRIALPFSGTDTLLISLQPDVKTEEQVIVSSSRTHSRIADLPMKVEIIGREDLEEEGGIKPGNITGILGDLSVIHLQNTSAVNGNTAIRMQGLDGRFTQLLRDGLPVYEGLSANFGPLSIAPLDLKQIEIIKGSASTLYGGGAIAGLINFISKTPQLTPQLSLMLNRTTLKEGNGNLYFAQRWKKTGISVFAGSTLQNASDVNKDGFSDVPRLRQHTLHPRLFFYPGENKTLSVGYSGTLENRKGGDMMALENGPGAVHRFVETNNSSRHSLDASWQQDFAGGGTLLLKGVGSAYNLESSEPGFLLKGTQFNSYGEASYSKKAGGHDWVAGLNYQGESFQKNEKDTSSFTNYAYATAGAFVQDGWHLTRQLTAEAGLRTDYHNRFGWFVLPRLALMYKPLSELSVRLSTGTGYKAPSEFSATNEQIGINDLAPSVAGLKAEKSTGFNFDVNFHKKWEDIDLTINQAFYLVSISNPVDTVRGQDHQYHLANLPFKTNSKGTDTYVRLALDELEFYLGYNHTLARYSDDPHHYVTFAPQDKFSFTGAYEIEGKWRMGLESSWVGNQFTAPGRKAPDYWFWAAMLQRNFGQHWTVVLNCENLFDQRQGKHELLYTGSISNPAFTPLWGPIDGRIVNLSVKWEL